jgi:hypothetical protein
LGCTIHQSVGFAGKAFRSLKAGFGTVETTRCGLNFGVAQEAALGISRCNGFGKGSFHDGELKI